MKTLILIEAAIFLPLLWACLTSGKTDVVKCSECKYNPSVPRNYFDDDLIESYDWNMCRFIQDESDGDGYCSCGKRNEKRP